MDHKSFTTTTETLVKAGLVVRTLVSNGSGGVFPGYKATPTALQDTASGPVAAIRPGPY
jgi:hypothetical protein